MDSLHLLAVSKPEADIRMTFEDIRQVARGFWEVKVEGVRVRRDIEKYLDHRLRSTAFRNWNLEERRETAPKLTSQANDMYVYSKPF
jgi:hypothetical protein